MIRKLNCCYAVFLLAMGAIPCLASEAPPQEKAEAPVTVIARLSDKDFDVREAAHKKLLQLGAVAEEALKKAADTTDPESQQRISTLLTVIDENRDKVQLLCRKELLKTFKGGPKEAGETVIRSHKEYLEFISTCQSDSVKESLKNQNVDFENEMVLAVAVGTYPSAVEDFIVKSSGFKTITPKGRDWVVEYTITYNDFSDNVEKYPLFMLILPKTDKTIKFKKHREKNGG